ncbi:osmoprotectant transport system substrate-binding protein [Virgibacillus natechei]|uniref:Osmoprotectant transport system substrate-binding protein n=1 Tax=Virgibacillus natechei TaxID=1216297 RepID=A0ABS4ICG0_9BACI|nr:osmoprotectant ABC transporter substrate-binding protein [Virgibacillus natechei]MBP1968330.1 osmoprotectant transport system substrate-binding protein [Virgibacillus natechei]UZD13464.1 osmoprotectant ABC transporter substrate-binding protein [Virgibacillus natechei]
MRKKMRLILTTMMTVLIISGCSLPGLSGPSENTIQIGALGTSESEIMAEMLSLMIERETDLNTELVTHLGSSIVQHQGMATDDLDLTSTRYTGTDLAGVLGLDPVKDPDKAMDIVQTEFDDQFNQTWAQSYGFENSYTLAVTQDFAEANDLEAISDLEPYADDLRFGVDNAWINREGDGYNGFIETYYEFGDVFPMNIGLVYQAAASGHMDAVLAYSSDGRIQEFDLKVLEDDLQFFPPYDTSPVIQNKVLEEHPEIGSILDRLSGTISTEKMQELNNKADARLENPGKIAEEFLEENNYFETSEGAVE